MYNKQFLEKILSQVPEDYYESGIAKNIFQKIWHTHKIHVLEKLISDKKFNNILDAGCASGYITQKISTIFPGSSITGIDIYPTTINYARKHYPKINFKVCDLQKIPCSSGTFDLIICYETIEHVAKPIQVLKELKRVAKKDATIIVAMDSGNLLFKLIWKIWENHTGKVWKNAHLNPYHHKQLEKVIQNAGFKITKKLFSHFGLEVVFILKNS